MGKGRKGRSRRTWIEEVKTANKAKIKWEVSKAVAKDKKKTGEGGSIPT